MLYSAFQAQADVLEPFKLMAEAFAGPLSHPRAKDHPNVLLRGWLAANDVFSRFKLTHHRPSFEIDSVTLPDGREVGITEEAAMRTPFGTLLRFKKDVPIEQPPVLLVAPMSGHFATLLRETARTMLQDHDVYITDWHNAREVPLKAGQFGLDEYVEHLMRFLEAIGPGAHMMAICQPCVPALAATALMAQDNHPAQPRSLSLLAGPIDCRINPTSVNQLATSKPYEWFEKKMIQTVPWRHRGGGRKVYPGFVQLTAFMSMNLERHLNAFNELYGNLVDGQPESLAKATATQTFYEEYFAVSDLPAEFYLQTIKRVFQDYDLARGELTWRGNRIEPEAIRRTALFTVEGERDDICSIGQTVAAQDLCSKVRPYMKNHHVQIGVGHYGVFSGRRWRNEIYPRVRDAIHSFA
jgi:poly(3-hydroxybutyrate) depolymerase